MMSPDSRRRHMHKPIRQLGEAGGYHAILRRDEDGPTITRRAAARSPDARNPNGRWKVHPNTRN